MKILKFYKYFLSLILVCALLTSCASLIVPQGQKNAVETTAAKHTAAVTETTEPDATELIYENSYIDGELVITDAPTDFGSPESQLESDYRMYYFDQNRSGYAALGAEEISAEQFAALDAEYPVYVNKYPAYHGGLLYDTGDEYNKKLLANIYKFKEHFGEFDTEVTEEIIIENGNVTYSSGGFTLVASGDSLRTTMQKVVMPDAEFAMDYLVVQSMMAFCEITEPLTETYFDGGKTVYRIYQDYGDEEKNETMRRFCSVTITLIDEDTAAVEGKNSECIEVRQGFCAANPEEILTEIEHRHGSELDSFKYEVFYSGVDYFGYSLPCYKIYVPAGNDEFDVYFYRAMVMS